MERNPIKLLDCPEHCVFEDRGGYLFLPLILSSPGSGAMWAVHTV